MKIKWKEFLLCIALPLVVGAISATISGGSREAFSMLTKPPLSPPAWLFPVVWTILYTLMGVASYLVLAASSGSSMANERADAWFVYVIQLIVNFFWSILFFNLEVYLFSFIWLVFLWILIMVTILRFGKVSKCAAKLMVPYLLWVSFAGYLNLGIYLLNR